MRKVWLFPLTVGLAVLLLCLASAARPVLADPEEDEVVGVVLDMDVSTAYQYRPDVAWNINCVNPDKFLVVYDRKDGSTNYNIWGRYVNGDGLVNGPGPFQITSESHNQGDPAVAFIVSTSNWLVVWEDYRNGVWEIWAQRVDCSKKLVGAALRMTNVAGITIDQRNPDVVCGYGSGSGCWVVWEDYRNGAANPDIYAQKVTTAGALEGGNFRLNVNKAAQRNPAIAYNPENNGCEDLGSFMVVWDDARNSAAGNAYDIYAQQLGWISPCGGNLPVYTGVAEQTYPDIAYGAVNDRYEVVWQDKFPGNYDIARRMLNPGGVALGWRLFLTPNAADQMYPRVAYDDNTNNQFATVWQDLRNGNRDIYRQRNTGLGALFGVNQVIVASSTTEEQPAIAFGSTSNHYFIPWRHSTNGIQGRANWP